jgi:hypothetical protein
MASLAVYLPGCPACGGAEITATVPVDATGQIVAPAGAQAACGGCGHTLHVDLGTLRFYADAQQAAEADPDSTGDRPPGVGE